VFDDQERFVLLMLLWNYKMEATVAMERDDVPVERVEAYTRELARNDLIVTKLGGDPTKPAFGLNPG
jgi:hypothetical protein